MLSRLLSWWPVERALYVACALGIFALAMMAAGVLLGTSLPVVASMSLAQGVGALACAVFGLSIAAEAGARRSKSGP